MEHIEFPVHGVDTHRPRPASPTHKRLRVSSETAAELSDRQKWSWYFSEKLRIKICLVRTKTELQTYLDSRVVQQCTLLMTLELIMIIIDGAFVHCAHS